MAMLHKNQEAAHITQLVITIGFILSLSMGFLEMITLSILSTPSGFSSFTIILSSIAETTCFFFLSYVILWFLAIAHMGRFLKLEKLPLAVSLALFEGVFFTLALFNNQIRLSLSLTEVFKLLILFSISLLISIGAYFTTTAVAHMSFYKNMAKLFNVAIPFVFAETMIFVWLSKYRNNLFSSFSFSLVFSIYLLIVLFTIVLFYRISKNIKTITLLTVFTLLVILSPFVNFIVMMGARASLKRFEEIDHQINHVILIIDDTLRPDVLSCYNPKSISTPHIDQLARDGVLFKKAISVAPWTLPSVASIMSGLSPSVHKATGRKSKLPDTVRMLAEYMRDADYYTAAIGRNRFLIPNFNISQGFLEYNFFPKPRVDQTIGMKISAGLFPNQFLSDASTGDLTNLTINWLESNYKKDFFLWIHYFDPHQPYAPPPEFFPEEEPLVSIGKSFSDFTGVRGGYFVPTFEERAWIKKLYEAEVRYVDENIGKLLEELKRLNLYDESLIIFTSDHGEEFWEHDGYEHGHTLYNEVLWVPLIIKLPLSASRQQINTMVSTQAVMPTILDLCGIEYDSDYLSVSSLSPLWGFNDQAFEEQPIVSTGLLYYENRESVIFDGLKYIHSFLTNQAELYDLDRDPNEQTSIISLSPDKVLKAKTILEDLCEIAEKLAKHYNITNKEGVELDKDTIRQLKSLGYIR